MNKSLLAVLIAVVLLTGPVFSQEMTTEEQELQEILEKTFPAETVEVDIQFRVHQVKTTVGFHLIGSEKKGFRRRLTRVTAEIVNISEIHETYKYRELVKEYLQKNAPEIDLAVRYRSTLLNGVFSAASNWTVEDVKDFLAQHKKDRNTLFSGTLVLDLFKNAPEKIEIRRVKLSAYNLNPVKK